MFILNVYILTKLIKTFRVYLAIYTPHDATTQNELNNIGQPLLAKLANPIRLI
jgi:hypothetical protein